MGQSYQRMSMNGLSVCALLLLLPAVLLAQTDSELQLLRGSTIVFVGTISRIGSAVAEVPNSPNEIVAKVDAVIEQPANLRLKSGDEITVLLQRPAQLKSGTRATFYANPWIIGKGVAVREVGHEVIETSQTSANETSQTHVAELKQQLDTADLRARIDAADAVVLGHISAVQTAPKGVQRSVTEHDPEWRDAIVDVTSWIKGSPSQSKIVVRFAASLDVAWSRAPKLKQGNENILILKKAEPSASRPGGAKSLQQVYTVLNANDVLPKEQADHVRGLMAQPASSTSKDK